MVCNDKKGDYSSSEEMCAVNTVTIMFLVPSCSAAGLGVSDL